MLFQIIVVYCVLWIYCGGGGAQKNKKNVRSEATEANIVSVYEREFYMLILKNQYPTHFWISQKQGSWTNL